ncbi:hypothetical protein MKX01_022237, partial [Papaver californicum]
MDRILSNYVVFGIATRMKSSCINKSLTLFQSLSPSSSDFNSLPPFQFLKMDHERCRPKQ